jgi:hypothetical protein
MDNLERINNEIYEMEHKLLSIIEEKVNLFDPEVVVASEKLDFILDEYNNLIK